MKKEQTLKPILISILFLLFIGLSYVLSKKAILAHHNGQLREAITSLNEAASPSVTLNEILPFDWDRLFVFKGADKNKIENEIGFKSIFLQGSDAYEKVQLVFVKGNSLVASVCDYEENLGYRINVIDTVAYDEEIVFSVGHFTGSDVVCLTEGNTYITLNFLNHCREEIWGVHIFYFMDSQPAWDVTYSGIPGSDDPVLPDEQIQIGVSAYNISCRNMDRGTFGIEISVFTKNGVIQIPGRYEWKVTDGQAYDFIISGDGTEGFCLEAGGVK